MSEETEIEKLGILKSLSKWFNVRTVIGTVVASVIIGVGAYGFTAISNFTKNYENNKSLEPRMKAVENSIITHNLNFNQMKTDNELIKQSQEVMQKSIEQMQAKGEQQFTNIYNLLLQINKK